MNGEEKEIVAEAAAWHAASATDDMDWDGFTAWLEADPRHRECYDQVALADDLLDEHREALVAATEEPIVAEPPAVRSVLFGWKRWAGIAIAASLLVVLAVPQFLKTPSETYVTDAVSRNIALTDGSSVLLAPHSRLTVEGDRQEQMALNGGAWFDIRHDPSRSLAIRAGDVVVSDIGTQFDIQADGDHVRVQVGEGQVKVASQALSQPIHLTQGRGLLYDGKAGTALVSSVSANAVGEWRSGRLSYASTPLSLVAADLSRYAGVTIDVADMLRNKLFSGTLVIGDGEGAIRDLSQVMDLELSGSAGNYRLDERKR